MLKNTILSLFVLILFSCESDKPTSQTGFFDSEFTTSEAGKQFIKEREGFSELAYFDGTWTIGFGNTYYPDGQKVKQGDRITRQQGSQIIDFVIAKDFEPVVNKAVVSEINQSQFDALISYAYNRGNQRLKNSQLLKMVNQNPQNEAIRGQFVKEWGTNTRFKNGLIRRRKQEADLYFSETNAILPEYQPDTKTNFPKWIILIISLVLFLGFSIYLFSRKLAISIKITKQLY
jgi:lysozyme